MGGPLQGVFVEIVILMYLLVHIHDKIQVLLIMKQFIFLI